MTGTYEHSPGSLSSNTHAGVDFNLFYKDILSLVPAQGVYLDIGGVGRDGVNLLNRATEASLVICIDPDRKRFDEAQQDFPNIIRLAQSWNDLQSIRAQRQLAYIQDGLPALQEFNRIAGGVKGDFVLCNAVMMFIPAAEHQSAIQGIADVTADSGLAVIRYRTENLNTGMIKIDHAEIEDQCRKAGFTPERTTPIPDPLGRSHVWHQLLLRKPGL